MGLGAVNTNQLVNPLPFFSLNLCRTDALSEYETCASAMPRFLPNIIAWWRQHSARSAALLSPCSYLGSMTT